MNLANASEFERRLLETEIPDCTLLDCCPDIYSEAERRDTWQKGLAHLYAQRAAEIVAGTQQPVVVSVIVAAPMSAPVLTSTDIKEIEKVFSKHLNPLVQPLEGPAARVDLKGLMRRTGLKERTLRRYIAGKIIPVYQAVEGGKLLFDLLAVERALKRYHRSAVGDDDL